MAAMETTDESSKAPYSLNVHEMVMNIQQQHGLRPDNDYVQYRHYVTNRLRRIRSLANFKYGKGRGFVPHELTVDDTLANPNLIMIPLLNAERAWSYAMQIKQELELAKQGHGKLSSHLIARLRKASVHASEFEKICLSHPADARTCLEATAYASWLKGNLHLEQESWNPALEAFSSALAIVKELGTVGTIEQQDLFCSRAESIEQSLRYCKYNLNDEQDLSELGELASGNAAIQAKLDSVLGQARRDEALTLEEIRWRGKTISVRSEELKLVVLRARTQDEELFKQGEGASENLWTKTIGVYDDALKAANAALFSLESLTSGGALVESERIDLKLLCSMLAFKKSQRMQSRHLRLCLQLKRKWKMHVLQHGSSSSLDVSSSNITKATSSGVVARAEDLVHLYDALKQVIEEACKIHGIEDDDELIDYLNARLLAIRAHRCFYLGEVYSISQNESYDDTISSSEEGGGASKSKSSSKGVYQAISLYDFSNELLIEAMNQLKDCVLTKNKNQTNQDLNNESIYDEFHEVELDIKELENLKSEVAGAKARAKVVSLLNNDDDNNKNKNQMMMNETVSNPLLNRLNEYNPGLMVKKDPNEIKKKRKDKNKKNKDLKKNIKTTMVPPTSFTYNMTSLPPTMEPIAGKPMLFDLAHNFIEFPNLDAKAGVFLPPAEGGGLFGWFRS